MANILTPIKAPFPAEVVEGFKRYPQRDGYVIGLFRVFANSVRLLNKGFVNLLDKASPLPVIEREIIILRISANNKCEYEWGVHVSAFSEYAGLTKDQVSATVLLDHTAQCWDEKQSTLIQCIDELCDKGVMSSTTLKKFRNLWDLEQQLEILTLAGSYHTIAFIANASELPWEEFAEHFPRP